MLPVICGKGLPGKGLLQLSSESPVPTLFHFSSRITLLSSLAPQKDKCVWSIFKSRQHGIGLCSAWGWAVSGGFVFLLVFLESDFAVFVTAHLTIIVSHGSDWLKSDLCSACRFQVKVLPNTVWAAASLPAHRITAWDSRALCINLVYLASSDKAKPHSEISMTLGTPRLFDRWECLLKSVGTF